MFRAFKKNQTKVDAFMELACLMSLCSVISGARHCAQPLLQWSLHNKDYISNKYIVVMCWLIWPIYLIKVLRWWTPVRQWAGYFYNAHKLTWASLGSYWDKMTVEINVISKDSSSTDQSDDWSISSRAPSCFSIFFFYIKKLDMPVYFIYFITNMWFYSNYALSLICFVFLFVIWVENSSYVVIEIIENIYCNK